MLFVRFLYCSLALSFIIFCMFFFYQFFGYCKTKACILWTDSASFTRFGTLKLCDQWNACFCVTSCFEKRLPHLLEMYTPGCCSGISFISFILNAYLVFLSEYLRAYLEKKLKTVVASQTMKTLCQMSVIQTDFQMWPPPLTLSLSLSLSLSLFIIIKKDNRTLFKKTEHFSQNSSKKNN
jgi:hypothetical protein